MQKNEIRGAAKTFVNLSQQKKCVPPQLEQDLQQHEANTNTCRRAALQYCDRWEKWTFGSFNLDLSISSISAFFSMDFCFFECTKLKTLRHERTFSCKSMQQYTKVCQKNEKAMQGV